LACRRHRRLLEAVRGARAALAPMLTEPARRRRQRARLGHGASSSCLLRDDDSFGDRRVPRWPSSSSYATTAALQTSDMTLSRAVLDKVGGGVTRMRAPSTHPPLDAGLDADPGTPKRQISKPSD